MSTTPPKLIALSNGGHAIVDQSDFEFLSQWSWRKSSAGYAIRDVNFEGKAYKRSMHRIVADAPDGVLVDHFNRDRLDNRRHNLRLASDRQNSLNRTNARKYKGVYQKGNRFESRIKADGRSQYLGMFPNEESAARAYDAAALKFHGTDASLNFPNEGDQHAA